MSARLGLAAAAVLSLATTAAAGAENYQYFVSGNPADVTTPTRGLVVMQGGGDDVDENYVRMGEAAGGGDFVVLRASGTDEYGDYIYALCACDSVETIVFANREAASEPFVIETIRKAEAIFIAGGDQSNYVRFWKDTPVEDAIQAVLAKPAPIGGTSAGMAILGEFSYSAMTPNSLLAETALTNPYDADVTIETDFLHIRGMQGIITDQHLIERDRIGRTVTLMARLLQDGATDRARAIAADRETAVHLDPATGDITIHATADHETPYVYFLQSGSRPARCEPGQPLSFSGIEVHRLAPGGRFNIRDWQGTGGIVYTFTVTDGELVSSRDAIY